MKVLWCAIDRSRRAATHFNDLRNAFMKLKDVEVTLIEKTVPLKYTHPYYYVSDCSKGNIKNNDITNICKFDKFDVIIVDAPFAFLYEDWQNINIPTYFIIEDEHGWVPEMQVRCAEINNISILYRYQNFLKTFPNLTVNCKWFPHSININRFKPMNIVKKYGILQTGVISGRNYPLRAQIHEMLKDNPHYTYIPRPKDGSPNPWPVGDDYVKLLNQAKVVVTGLSKFNYPIMKVFEITASNCVLACNFTSEMAELGFSHGVNMCSLYSEQLDKMNSVLNTFSKTKTSSTIIKNANNLIKERHTNEIRAKELFEILKEVLSE